MCHCLNSELYQPSNRKKIQWFVVITNEKCKEISQEALKFYQTYLSRESI